MSRPLYLASASPRRRDLLQWCGFDVTVCPQDVDETHDPLVDPVSHATTLARTKLLAGRTAAAAAWVAADTVVHLDGRLYEKPADRDEAIRHLQALSGREHHVTTGVCIAAGATDPLAFHVTTRVRFRSLSADEIAAYVATGEADDKAGAYGIQGRAGAFVAEVHGSWTNVMGLPVEATLQALAALGVTP